MLLALMMTGTATAEFDYRRIGVGVAAGVSNSNMDNYPGEYQSRTGYIAGFTTQYPLHRNLAFQMDFIFVGKGFEVIDTTVYDLLDNLLGTAGWKAIVSYFEIPVMAKLIIPAGPKYIPYLTAGGFWATPIRKKQSLTTPGIVLEFDMEKVRKFDWGVCFGGGIDIKAGEGWVNLDVRYDISTQSMLKYTNYYSRAWLFRFGYHLPLGAF